VSSLHADTAHQSRTLKAGPCGRAGRGRHQLRRSVCPPSAVSSRPHGAGPAVRTEAGRVPPRPGHQPLASRARALRHGSSTVARAVAGRAAGCGGSSGGGGRGGGGGQGRRRGESARGSQHGVGGQCRIGDG
jgi:hypothetical protein